MRSDVFFFLGVLVFFFVIWYSTGGPDRPISFAGPFITPVHTYGDEQEAYGSLTGGRWNSDFDLPSSGGISTDATWWSSGENDGTWHYSPEGSPVTSRIYGPSSPYAGQVTIASVSGADATDADEEYIILSANDIEGTLNITGWRLVSVQTDAYGYIPSGTNRFVSGSVNDIVPITVSSGDEVIVVSGRSPVGISFRENMCTGYLEEYQEFTPSLRNSCPDLMDTFEYEYGGNEKNYELCRDYIANLRSCEIPSDTPSRFPDACYAFIDKYANYSGCVNTYGIDSDFYSDTWRVYLGHHEKNKKNPQDLWEPHSDTLKLLDAEGRTVDTYTY